MKLFKTFIDMVEVNINPKFKFRKKSVTITYEQNEIVRELGINCSKLLQESILREKIKHELEKKQQQ
jgi:hypothetical protein